MPTYEFKCEHCGNAFDEFLPVTSGLTYECPICGGIAQRKISAGIGLIFKGSGFYITDYKKPEVAKVKKGKELTRG